MKNSNPTREIKAINKSISNLIPSPNGSYKPKHGVEDKKLKVLKQLYEMKTLTAHQIQILIYTQNAMTTVYSALQALIRKKMISFHIYGEGIANWERFYFLTKKGWEFTCISMKLDTSETKYRRYQEPFKNAYYHHRKKLLDFWIVLLMECRRPDCPYQLVRFIPEWKRLNDQNIVLRFESFDERESTIQPDATFILHDRATGQHLLYFLEIDTGTESVILGQYPSVLMKINCYYRAFHQGVFRDLSPEFNSFTGARLLFITSTKARMQNIIDNLKLDEPFRDAFLFSTHDSIYQRGVLKGEYRKSGFEGEVGIHSSSYQADLC